MQDCKKGQPMFSGHVSVTEDFDDEIRNQMEITVDRLMDEIEKQISEHWKWYKVERRIKE